MEIKTWHLFEQNRAYVRRHTTPDEYGIYIFEADLVAEPDNPYSKSGHAISVRYDDRVIGYIPSEDKKIFPAVARLAASGYDARVLARMWKSGTSEYAIISLALGDPAIAIPLNDPPTEGWALLPEGKTIQVTKEEHHFDVLQDFVPASGRGLLLVTLHEIETGVRSKRKIVEVRLEGERIGELSPVSSAKLLPAVQHLDALGLTTVCRAVITGSALAAEMVLKVATAAYLDDSILDPEISPLPRLTGYEEDPDNYDLPDRYPEDRERSEPETPQPAPPKPTLPEPSPAEPLTPMPEQTRSQNHPWPDPVSAPSRQEPPLAPPAVSPFIGVAPSPDPIQIFNSIMCRPSQGKKATPLQRGYTRSKTKQYLPGMFGPRIDGARVDQCVDLLRAFGQDPAPIYKRGWDISPVWWIGMIVGFLLIGVPGIGPFLVFPWLVLFFGVIWHFISKLWTRRPLPGRTRA
ncbi:hypothetical protein OS127_03085 [Corynebacterium sp. P6129]|uniref:HIRAN domain-containing protein n=1 Tax=Corynebacterium antarcticum TaxID=2800405 RepID=UPI0022610237|nr:hypothetical protein [Corynebacterium antarcticum]MCX7491513.1 hypothetical protein [Corynebacterium antarcticum]